jgi:hypothetical protein
MMRMEGKETYPPQTDNISILINGLYVAAESLST